MVRPDRIPTAGHHQTGVDPIAGQRVPDGVEIDLSLLDTGTARERRSVVRSAWSICGQLGASISTQSGDRRKREAEALLRTGGDEISSARPRSPTADSAGR
jgi:hypothetical protein